MYQSAAKTNDLNSVLDRYAPLVQRLANTMINGIPPNVEVGDLIQAGLIGLIDAQKTFKPALEIPFEAYLVKKVKWAMFDELRRQDWLPKSLRTKRKALDKAVDSAKQRHGKGHASDEEIAAELNMDVDSYRKFCGEVCNLRILSIEDMEESSGNQPQFEDHSATPEQSIIEKEQREILIAAIEELPEREALVMSLYYEEEMTYREIADILEVSTPRIHQLHAQAISRIRGTMARRQDRRAA